MKEMEDRHYGRLLAMAALSFGAMYVLMFGMVESLGDVFHNLNQLYMAGLMTAPMVVIEISVMRAMYRSKRRNALIALASVLALATSLAFIRRQTAISDEQFLRSMIPHHSGAILMCQKASLRDPEIKELCRGILASQQSEIDQMKRILDRLASARASR